MKNKKTSLEIGRFGLVILGSLAFSVAINLFVTPLGLYNGGVLGISQVIRTILQDYLHISFPESIDFAGILYFILNAPLFILAYKGVSRIFFYKTLISVILTTFVLTIIPVPNPLIIEDPLTSCIIGGLMYGAGVGLTLFGGGSGGGIDILGIYLSKKLQNFSVGKVSIAINGVIYLVCAILFGLPIAIYSIIYAAISSFAIDRVHSQNIMVEAMIFTKHNDMAAPIMQEMTRGVTEWKGDGAYTKEDTNILVTAISKYEQNALRRIVLSRDPQAFIIFNKVSGIEGNYVKRL